jgi:hypothetical protein
MSSFLPGTRPPTRRTGAASSAAGRRRGAVRPALWVLAGALLTLGCDDGNGPAELPLGRTSKVQIGVRTPYIRQGTLEEIGALEQGVVWKSNGTWQLTERISYKGILGDETVRRSTEDAGALAQRYANWIALVNARGGPLQIVDFVSPDVVPICGPSQSRVTVEIADSRRSTSTRWSRCGDGTLGTLTHEAVGPDSTGAVRVIEAVRQLRHATLDLDREFLRKRYAYEGSLPFRTIERGELTKAPLLVPRLIEDQASYAAFWAQYMTATLPPVVDFSTDVVLVAAVGTRQEAGDSVEIRRVLQIDFGTKIELWERRSGNFCTPAPRSHTPFHVAIAPIAVTKRPVFFELEQQPDFVPCG